MNHLFDKSLPRTLAETSMTYEKCLQAEQHVYIVIHTFARVVVGKSKKELVLLRKQLIKDAKKHPTKAHLYALLLKAVAQQLNRFSAE